MTDESFVLQRELHKEQLLLGDELFIQFYITTWDHIDKFFVPFVVRMRYIACFAVVG